MAAKSLWEQVKGELKSDLDRATFDTWVRDAEGLTLADNVLTVGVANDYARSFLEKLIGSMAARYVAALLETSDAQVRFVTIQDFEGEDQYVDVRDVRDDTLTLQRRYLSLYDEVVRPERIVVVPRYYLRWVPWLGVDLAWIPLGFRQVAFLNGSLFEAGDEFEAPARSITSWSGVSLRTFRRKIIDPRLRWFIEPIQSDGVEFRWNDDKDRPERVPQSWRVVMSMPLTPFDQDSLKNWLIERGSSGTAPGAILQEALQTPIDKLLPWPEALQDQIPACKPISVQDLVMDVLDRDLDPATRVSILQLADSLSNYITGNARSPILITHYFIKKWLPLLKPGPAWLVTLLRGRCYYNRENGELRDQTTVHGGHIELASRLGLARSKTLGEWFCGRTKSRGKQKGAQFLPYFVTEISRSKQQSNELSIEYKVRMIGEPFTPTDLKTYNLQQPGAEGPTPAVDTIDHASTPAFGTMDNIATPAVDTINGTHAPADVTMEKSSTPANDIVEREPAPAVGTNFKDSLLRLSRDSIKDYLNTTTSISRKKSKDSRQRSTPVVVMLQWDIKKLLVHNKVDRSIREQLLSINVTGEAFVSWLIYAASSKGASIKNPVAHSVSRLRQDPHSGAGEVYDRVAQYPPEDLIDCICRSLKRYDPEFSGSNREWKRAMRGTSELQMVSLAEQLLSLTTTQEVVS
jgi:hypothetical protein